MNDLKFAFRQLLKNPGFTAVAVLTLALGIGASTAIYSVVNSALLNPVPGRQPERLMQIAQQSKKQQTADFFVGVSPPVLQALRDNQDFFADLAWCNGTWLSRKTDEFTQEVMGAEVSPNFFTLLGVKPLLGRTFARDELTPIDENRRPVADSAIVISYSLWKSRLGGDAGVIGRQIELGANHYTVIGVMPSHFRFPYGSSEFWLAMEDPSVRPDIGLAPNYRVLARLKPGTDERQTNVMLEAISQRVVQEYSTHRMYSRDVREEGWSIRVRPLRHLLLNEKLQQTLFGLLGAIGFVLLMVCANIANLMLARTENRQQELAVRASLGAGRLRLLRQLLTESILLAVMGGLAGLLTTWWGMKLLVALIPDRLPRLQAIHIDTNALAFTLLISLGTGLLFGLAPALRGSRTPLANALKQAGTGATAGAVWRRYRSVLVVTEVALAVVLLAGAGLMIQSVVRLLHVNPGFDPENLLAIRVELPWEKYNLPANKERRNLFLAQLHERLSALPGVSAVGIDKKNFAGKFQFDSQPDPVEVRKDACGVEESDLFRAMRIPVLAGRYFNKSDIAEDYFYKNDLVEGTTAVIINQMLARLCWPGGDALGKKFASAEPRSKRRYEVVGIVADTRDYSFDQAVLPTLYRPYQEFDLTGQPPTFVLRTAGNPVKFIPAIRKELKAAEPAMMTPGFRVLKQVLYDSTQAHRTYMLYLVVFAGAGLLLAALGIYGVLAYSVARRTREFGIRMAVGAERRHVLGMVMAEGSRLVAIGLVVGLMAAFWLTRLIRHQLFDVSPTEPRVFVAVVVLLLVIALLACWLPARRASRVHPMEALRYE